MFSSMNSSNSSLDLHNRKRSHWTARSIQDLERRGDHHCSGGRKLLQITKMGQPELTTAMHEIVVRERWRETGGLAGIRADGLHSHSEDVALHGQELRTLR